MIDTTGKWWKGSEFADVEEYLRALKPGGYDVDRVIEAKCGCGGRVFTLEVDQDEELARTTCVACGRQAFVSDAGEHCSDATPRRVKCPSRHAEYELGLGLCVRDAAWVR
jgi:hypothetical protein